MIPVMTQITMTSRTGQGASIVGSCRTVSPQRASPAS